MTDLSIIIPARNEMFLAATVQDLLATIRGDTEIIVVLDGCWAEPPIPQHEKVQVLRFGESVGQRAACNAGARVARGKYLMKVDAHCAFDEGFDQKLLADMQSDWTMVPVMRNLHIFDWVCSGGHRRYQGPSGPCKECGATTQMEMVWVAKSSPQSKSYCFDASPHFQYFGEYTHRPVYQEALRSGHITETMSLQGSCFLLTREKWFELNICDEAFGSWGSQGIEVAAKTWLSGGRCVVNHNTWYAHCFRSSGGDFGFPYPLSNSQVEHAKEFARKQFFEGSWGKQVRPLSWLVEKFWPVPGWSQADLEALQSSTPKQTAGILYYTDNRLDESILRACQQQLQNAAGSRPIVSVSLKPMDFGSNIVLPLERGYLTMFRQIIAGLEALDTDYVFFCEHDVLYHASHFDFIPPTSDRYYYNTNVWKVRAADGHALHYDCRQTSGLVADRQLLIRHYRERVKRTTEKYQELGDTRAFRNWIRSQGFEPGTHGRPERVDDYKAESYQSAFPNIDIRHEQNLTPSRWSRAEFRDPRNCRGWIEAESVPGWICTAGNFDITQLAPVTDGVK